MGRKGYNWKSRQVVKTIIDDTKTNKIRVDFDGEKSNYDQCNALVLPSEKRKTKIKKNTVQIQKLLSKKQRKHLEKIVEKKKKKENRASLLEALSQVQATPEELSQLTSIASVQTKGLKKYFQEQNQPDSKPPRSKRKNTEIDANFVVNSLSGSKRKRISLISPKNGYDTNDLNVVGLEVDESDETDEDETEEESNDEDGTTKESNIGDGTLFKEDGTLEKLETRENVPGQLESPKNPTKTTEIKEISRIDTDLKVKTNKIAPKSNTNMKPLENHPSIFIPVSRTPEIQESRLKLPILAEEQEIMETINGHNVILIAGETGSGKTTQIPQFLYEAGYARTKQIAITEPRRVAAIAMSKRVGLEMSQPESVSYLIRFEGNVTDKTEVKFMTDGVLLKELQSDFLLTKYSVIILDEAHERSVYTDILIGLLSRIVPLRNKKGNPLKLIIMSATLRLDDFIQNGRLFKQPPPVIKVDARQFPVTVHFNKRTPTDYIKEAFNKTVKIHQKLPDGAILVFVTGQLEVMRLVGKLKKAFPLRQQQKNHKQKEQQQEEWQNDDGADVGDDFEKRRRRRKKIVTLPTINLDDYSLPGAEESEVESIGDDSDDEEDEEDVVEISSTQPLWTLPLYSLLPSYKQAKVFDPPPAGCRLCIVATNVAETSLTIPNVKYVVDTGKAKLKLYDKITGVTSYQVMWTSKASADQRAGRAGRTAPGHCYRLYSSAVFNDTFQPFAKPEIQQKPVDDLYLQMKCMNIDKIINFPFPSAPDLLQLKTAEARLEILGALEQGQVTPLGKAIAQFPVLPRFGKMLALSHQQNLLPYTICMVAALSVQEVLLETPIGVTTVEEAKSIRQKWTILRRQWAGFGHSLLLGDPMVLLRAVGAAEYANADQKLDLFCRENGLRQKAVIEIRKLRMQLTNEIKINVPDCDLCVDPKLQPPTEVQAKLLRQILLAGMGDQVAKRIDPDELKQDEDKLKYKYAYRCMDMEEPVFLHSSSVLRKSQPEFVIYQEIYETNKLYMRGITVIEPDWLPLYVPQLCNLSPPLLDPEPTYRNGKIYCTVNGTFGRQAWQLPAVEIEFPKSAELYKWFGRFLLEGVIFEKLKKYSTNLLSTPSTMIKTWAKLQPRTDAILKALISKDISSKSSLNLVWEQQPQFLLREYQKWLPESAHNEISLLWPPID